MKYTLVQNTPYAPTHPHIFYKHSTVLETVHSKAKPSLSDFVCV